MRFVERAEKRPHGCAAVPFISSQDPEGFIDTGNVLPGFDSHIYFSVKAVKEANRILDIPTKEEHQTVLNENETLKRQVAKLEEELNASNNILQAIDVIESKDFRARKKPGRKPQQKAAA